MTLYETLKHKTLTTEPYRGATDRYPLGNRRHNIKNIYVRTENGEPVYDLAYGFNHDWEDITREQYLANPRGYTETDNYDYDDKGRWIIVGKKYGRYFKTPRILGTVRPDNTFEFVTRWFGQSEVMLFARDVPTINCLIHSDSRKGGGVIKDSWRNSSVIIPIFQGLRIDLNTLKIHESQDVRIVKNIIDRKLSKPLMDKYGTMIKVARPMFISMDNDSFIREVLDIVKPSENINHRDLAVKANDEGRYFDCAVLLAYEMNASGLRHTVQWFGNGWSRKDWTPNSVYDRLIDGLTKEIYRTETPFKQKEYKAGEDYGTIEWGMKVFCNGEQVKQY